MNKKFLLVILLLVTTILILHTDEAVSQELTRDKGQGQKAALAKRLALLKKHFVNLDYKVDGQKRTAALFVPEKYDASKSWPLVIFLHGGGSGGDNNGKGGTRRSFQVAALWSVKRRDQPTRRKLTYAV